MLLNSQIIIIIILILAVDTGVDTHKKVGGTGLRPEGQRVGWGSWGGRV